MLVAVALISVSPNDTEILEHCPQTQGISTSPILFIMPYLLSVHLAVGDEDEYSVNPIEVWSMSVGILPFIVCSSETQIFLP
jgi:hypothetical protein